MRAWAAGAVAVALLDVGIGPAEARPVVATYRPHGLYVVEVVDGMAEVSLDVVSTLSTEQGATDVCLIIPTTPVAHGKISICRWSPGPVAWIHDYIQARYLRPGRQTWWVLDRQDGRLASLAITVVRAPGH